MINYEVRDPLCNSICVTEVVARLARDLKSTPLDSPAYTITPKTVQFSSRIRNLLGIAKFSFNSETCVESSL